MDELPDLLCYSVPRASTAVDGRYRDVFIVGIRCLSPASAVQSS